jgi:hypothetical protein
MATVFQEYTTENSVFCTFLRAKGLDAKGIHNEIFSVYGGKGLSRKAVHNWVENSLKYVLKSQMMPDQVALLRLRQKQLCSG